MRTWKRFVSGALSATMLFSFCTIGAGAVDSKGTETSASVATLEELKNALSNETVTTITLTADIAVPAGPENNIVLEKAVTIDGAGKTITKTFNDNKNTDGYGDYEEVFQINAAGVTIQDVTVAGLADGQKDEAAVYINANGTTDAKIVIDNCTFLGADSVTASSGGTGILTATGSTGAYLEVKNNSFTNVKYGMYFNSVSNAAITGNEIDGTKYNGIYVEGGSASVTITDNTLTDIASANYTDGPIFNCGMYIGASCDNLVLKNNSITLNSASTGKLYANYAAMVSNAEGDHLYATLPEAVSAASADETIALLDDVTLTEQLNIDKAITLNGNGFTIERKTTAESAVGQKAAILVTANATLENLTVSGPNTTATGWNEGEFGIKVWATGDTTPATYDVAATMKDVTVTGANAGILVSHADVTMTGDIDVSDNEFGGIELTKGGKLDISAATLKNDEETDSCPVLWNDRENQQDKGTLVMGDKQILIKDMVTADKDHYYVNDKYAPTVDLSQAGGAKLTGTTFSGNVDTRTFRVTDSATHTLYESLFETGEENGPWKLKDGKALIFATIQFGGLADEAYYTVQQINPALAYAYSATDFPDSTKTRTYLGSDLKDGLCFPISNQEGTIVFKVAKTSGAGVIADLTDAATYTYTNDIVFAASDAPAESAPVVEVAPSVSGTTASATVSDNAISGAVSNVAPTTTVEIVATTTNDNVTAAQVTLGKDAVAALVDDDSTAKVAAVDIKTDVGTVTLSNSAIETIAANSTVKNSGAVVEVKKAETPSGAVAAVEVTVKSNSNAVEIKDLAQPITISFNIGTGKVNPVLLYDDNGTLKNISSSKYDPETGIITGTTSHLTKFVAVDPMTTVPGGIGQKVTLTPNSTNDYLTIQVTYGGANSIYTVKAAAAVEIYVANGTVLNVWETTAVPTFDQGSFAPNSNPTILVNSATITAS